MADDDSLASLPHVFDVGIQGALGDIAVLRLPTRDLLLFTDKDYSTIPGLTGIVYTRFVPGNLVGPGLGLFVASVAVSLYPAWRAARLDPTAALRHAWSWRTLKVRNPRNASQASIGPAMLPPRVRAVRSASA